MAQLEAEVFARLLTEAVYRIRIEESKSIQTVQDELGYAIGKSGGASIEHWRKGHLPTKLNDVENLAREIFQRSHLGADWLAKFLFYGGHPNPDSVVNEAMGGKTAVSSPPSPLVPHTPPKPTHNLPPSPTRFIGREKELAEITERLHDPSCRLLTLVGQGGIGKTRLALQAATQMFSFFPDGCYFVPLASLSSADFLISTIANTIQFSFYSGEPPKSQLFNYLHEKNLLLILDNFEHLMSDVRLIAEILENAPKLQILVTSRERLNLHGEWVFQVRGMTIPTTPNGHYSPETYSALQLFTQSARRSNSDFVLKEHDLPHVIEICQLVEGLPLAIELAAAWVRLLPVSEIAQEIGRSYDFLSSSWRDMPERHRSLQSVFEYSWNLLPDPERQVLSRLSVFRGGFRRQAAEFVTGANLVTLSGLVDKSFLYLIHSAAPHSSNHRYEMHEYLRMYASEKLAERPKKTSNGQLLPSDKEKIQDKHCQYYTAFLNQREADLKGDKQSSVLEEIGEEIENIRAAWRWAVEQGKLNAIEQSLGALFHFYDIHSWIQEGEEAFAEAVQKLREIRRLEDNYEADTILGKLLARQGRFFHRLGLYRRARELLRESLAIFRGLGLPEETVFSLNNLGKIAYRLGEYPEARRLCEESITICRQIPYESGMVTALETLGKVAEDLGEYEEAKKQHHEGLNICRLIGDKQGVATFLNSLGYVYWRLGQYTEAYQLCQESLQLYQLINDRLGIAMCQKNLGNVAADTQDYQTAKAYYQQGLALCRGIGNQWGIAALLNNLGVVAWELGEYREAQQFGEEGLAIQRQIGYQWGVGSSLETLGNVAEAMGKQQQAKAYFLEALEIAMEIKALPLALDVLVGLARLLARDGAKTKAMEILAFVRGHSALDKEGMNKAEQLWGVLMAELTADEVKTAESRATTQSLENIATDILRTPN